MNKKTLTVTAIIGLFVYSTVFACQTGNYIADFDINCIEYIEDEPEIDLGFNVNEYLPIGFNAYADPIGMEGITFIKTEEPIELGFDTADYLPVCFDPYEVFFDLNSVEYIEDEEEIELNFNTDDYLPKGFDAYSNGTMPLSK
ncbi:MAG: hypothetical protein WBG90_10355 [Saonia sp.]